MRFAVLADIHGNLPALEAVLEDIERTHVDGVIVLGDIASRCPFPLETLNLVHSVATIAIRGNVDAYQLDYDRRARQGERQNGPGKAIDGWTYERIGGEGLAMIRSMPPQATLVLDGAQAVRLVHGSVERENEWIIPDEQPQTLDCFIRALMVTEEFKPRPLADWFQNIPEKVLACGHTHIPWLRAQNGTMAFNPGAVGMPINGDRRAQYALMSWEREHWQVDFRALEYDTQRTARAYETSGMLEACGGFARVFMSSMQTGRNALGFYLVHASKIARDHGHTGYEDLPDELWKQVEDTFCWDDFACP